MPGTTPGNLPYPLPTEPVADGAQAIRNLAEAIALQKILEVSPASGAQIAFTAIPQTFTHLRIVATLRAAGAVVSAPAFVQFNGDAGGNYGYERLQALGAAVSALVSANQTFIPVTDIPGASSTANMYGAVVVDIPNYRAATRKVLTASGGGVYAGGLLQAYTADWSGVAAITRIDLAVGGGFAGGSKATLYGLA